MDVDRKTRLAALLRWSRSLASYLGNQKEIMDPDTMERGPDTDLEASDVLWLLEELQRAEALVDKMIVDLKKLIGDAEGEPK
jgi:hypothetical protein